MPEMTETNNTREPHDSATPAESAYNHQDPPSACWTHSVVIIAALACTLGLLGGVAWWLIVDVPVYVVNADRQATMGERGLTSIFGMDAWFVALGAVIGGTLGTVVALRLGRRLGWIAPLLAVADALAAGALCWYLGNLLGPNNFSARLETIQPGETIPVDLTVTSWPSLAAWGFFAVLPVLIWATAARDPDDARPLLVRKRKKAT